MFISRGALLPPFSLPMTPSNDSSADSSQLKSSGVLTSTPATIPLVPKPRGENQPSNLLQERLKEAAVAAMKESANEDTTAPAAEGDLAGGLNDSSLII